MVTVKNPDGAITRPKIRGRRKKGSMLLLVILFVGAAAMYSTYTAMRPIAGDLKKGFSEHHSNHVQVAVDTFAKVRDDIAEREAEAEAVMEAKFKADEEREAEQAKAKAEPEAQPETKVEVLPAVKVEVQSKPDAEVKPEVKPEAEVEPHDATSTCLAMNSKQWLNATRYGNARSKHIGAHEFPMAQGPLLNLDIQAIVIGQWRS